MAQVDVFSLAAAVVALLLAAGLLAAWVVNRGLTAFTWWAATFALLAVWLATSTLRIGAPAPWLKWLSWTSFYAAACLVAYGLYREGETRANPLARMVTSGVLLVAIATGLTLTNAPPHYWMLLGPIPVIVFMAWSSILVFRAGAWGYGLTLLAGIAATAIRSLSHPAGLTRLFNPPPPPPPPPALRGGLAPGNNPGEAIALHPRPPAPGLFDFTPPPGPRPPVEHALGMTLITIVALLALAVALVLRNLLAELNRMRERSTTDAMTGLLNRATFEEAAAARLHESGSPPACLILFDIDHFKRINDTAGHAAGDRVIARLGQLLREMALPRAVAGRVGGEEFAVILSGSDLGTGRLYAEAIRAGLSAADFDDIAWEVTVSAGIALHRPDEGLHGLTARADKALYAAKANGRDRVVIADDLSGPGPRRGRQAGLSATA